MKCLFNSYFISSSFTKKENKTKTKQFCTSWIGQRVDMSCAFLEYHTNEALKAFFTRISSNSRIEQIRRQTRYRLKSTFRDKNTKRTQAHDHYLVNDIDVRCYVHRFIHRKIFIQKV